jgi:drug/metabolite transporter (DMT)-like permease
MKWYLISIGLSLIYTFYIVFSEILSNNFHLTPIKIFVNVILIAGLICVICYPRYIIIPKINLEYMLLLIIGFILFSQNYLLQLGTKSEINMGLIDAFAIAIYLPLITLIMFFIFKEKINKKKIIGIILISFAVYLILS